MTADDVPSIRAMTAHLAARDRLSQMPSQETLDGGAHGASSRDGAALDSYSPTLNDFDARSPEHLRPRLPPRPVGFWDDSLRSVRRDVGVLWARTTLVLMLVVLGLMSLYWGVLSQEHANAGAIGVLVVDFDAQVAPYNTPDAAPLVGPAVTALVARTVAAASAASAPCLGYQVVPAASFGGDPLRVRAAVYDWAAWAAVVVNPNATALLRAAVATANASYDPTGAVHVVLQTARDSATVQGVVAPQLKALMAAFTAAFGPAWANATLGAASPYSRADLARAPPAAVNPGVEPLFYDLRPFDPPTATPAVTIGLIYLIITSFFSVPFFMPIHVRFVLPAAAAAGHPPLAFRQFVIWRWVSSMTAYSLISLAYSLVSLAFRVPFVPPPASHVLSPPPGGATAYGHATFVVYWLLNWLGMAALGLACENAAMVVGGAPWSSVWLIFWVITNVATSFYALDLAPAFYRWGYAWPLRQVVEASRQLLFDLHPRIGLNFGILFVWVVLGTALFPFCCRYARWNAQRAAMKAAAAAAAAAAGAKPGSRGTAQSDVEGQREKGETSPTLARGGFLGGISRLQGVLHGMSHAFRR